MATSPEPISALNGDAKPAQATPLPEPAASNNAPANPEDATFETLLLTRPGRGVAPEEAGKGGLAEEATDKGPRVDAQAPEAPPADGKSPQTKNRRGGGGGPPSAVKVNKVDRWLNGGKTPAAAKGTVRKSSVMCVVLLLPLPLRAAPAAPLLPKLLPLLRPPRLTPSHSQNHSPSRSPSRSHTRFRSAGS